MSVDRIHYTQIDSTNAEAKRLIDSGTANHGTLISADYQTQGRGQYGRAWDSDQAQNALLSIIFKPTDLLIKEQFLLNMSVSLALVDVLQDFGIGAKVKWPNDIYVSDNKICGILIQNFLQGDTIQYSIIGIGLNVNQLSWPKEVPNPTSIAKELSRTVDLNEVVDVITKAVVAQYNTITHDPQKVRKTYQDYLYRRGDISQFQIGEDRVPGEIIGIDETGRLMIAHDNILKAYQHGEISMII